MTARHPVPLSTSAHRTRTLKRHLLLLFSVWSLSLSWPSLTSTRATAATPTATFSGFSETLVRYYQQEDHDRIQNLLAFIEILGFSANLPKIPELSFHLFGWGQLHLLDETKATGDLSAAYVSYRDPHRRLWLELGRQYLYQNQKVLHFDGAKLETRLPLGFGLRLFGGFAVRPQFAPSAGHVLAGVRASHRVGHTSEIGITFLETYEEGRPAHEVVGLDALVVPLGWLELSGSASVDIHLLSLRQAGGRLDLHPMRWLRFTAGYEFATPSAFVSKNSIFSVFSNNVYHEGYLQAWVYLFGRSLSLGADLRLLHLPDIDPETVTSDGVTFPSGEQNRLFVRWHYNKASTGWLGASLERVREGSDGHIGGRLFWQQRLRAILLAVDFQYFHYTRTLGGYPHGFFAAVSGQWAFAKDWELTGSLAFTSNPFVTQSWTGLLKLRYRFFLAFPSPSTTAASQTWSPKTGGPR